MAKILSRSGNMNRLCVYLSSYLNVCVDVGQINRAFNLLLKYSSPKSNQLIDTQHYNIVLKGWSRLGSITQIVETRMHMIKNKIEPNAETFAYILLGYSKSKSNSRGSIKKLVQEMKKRDIDSRTLFQSAYLDPSQRSSIKKLLTLVDPKYDDVFTPEPITYNCNLMDGIKQIKPRPYDCFGECDISNLKTWADEQRLVEWKSSVPIKSVDSIRQSSIVQGRYRKLWNFFHEMWRKSLERSLDEILASLQSQCAASDKIHLYPYLCSVDKKMLINLMLDEIENNANFASFSMPTSHLHLQFGIKVMTRYMRAKSIADGSHAERRKIYDSYITEYCSDPNLMGRQNSREYIQTKAIETKNYSIYRDRFSPIEQWPSHIVAAVGKTLYRIMIREVRFDPEVVRHPKREVKTQNLVHAFYTAYFQIDSSHKIKEEFRAHQDFEKFYQRSCSDRMKFDYNLLPTTSPPLPWLSHGFGGYLTHRSDLVRVPNPSAEQTILSMRNIDHQKLYPSLDSINALGLCPWIVNKEILDIVIDLFRAGGDRDLNVPLDQHKMSLDAPKLESGANKADRILYNKQKKKYDRKLREMSALRYDCLYRLSIANHFRDRVFWFPHNMDFRGRTYPIPPHFNHLGADLARSLLLFAKGQPLGDRGLDWLKIHLINLVGTKKNCSLRERLEYANSILHSDILDSADNPWLGRRWWTDNENPWQVLACCKEIAKAVRSEDSKQYVCHFPVHQDGSCNGLQHYAALGRDLEGGQAVNLIPDEKPQDVYSRVVEIVENIRQRDVAKGSKPAQMLEGFIQRKVIKQTVMTTVYGVTRYGARQQIAKQLSAKGYPEREIWQAAHYLTAKTFEAIGQMFNKSRLIQDWFNSCAYIIASKYKQPVTWETPLGFPVTQPYTQPQRNVLKRLLSSNVDIGSTVYNDPFSTLNSSKQRSGFPPNYIHSLDSSHMMLTSLFCQRHGITFVSVHDCFWTHPNTVDIMNQICREQFVALHSEPLLVQLSNQFLGKINLLEPVKGAARRKKKVGQDNQASPGLSDIVQTKTEELLVPPPMLHEEGNQVLNISPEDEFVHEDYLKLIDEDRANDNETATPEHELALSKLKHKPTHSLIRMYEASHKECQSKDRDTLQSVPKIGELDLNSVLRSTYFFS